MPELFKPASPPSASPSPPRPRPPRHVARTIFYYVLAIALINQNYVTSELICALTLVTLLYALYATAVLLLGLGLFAALRRQPVLRVPLLSRRCTPGGAYAILAVAVALFTYSREGSYGPRGSYEVMQTRSWGTYSAGKQLTVTGPGGPLPLSGLPMRCAARCDEVTDVCGAAIAALCPEPPPADAPHLVATFHLEVEDPFCYVPLVKSNKVEFHARASFVRTDEAGAKTSLMLNVWGTATVIAIGPMSCRNFRSELGQEVRERLMLAVNEQLAKR